jgi:hypothetical protein
MTRFHNVRLDEGEPLVGPAGPPGADGSDPEPLADCQLLASTLQAWWSSRQGARAATRAARYDEHAENTKQCGRAPRGDLVL